MSGIERSDAFGRLIRLAVAPDSERGSDHRDL